MRPRPSRLLALATAVLGAVSLAAAACAPEDGSAGGSGSGSGGASASAPSCTKASLALRTKGKVTVGTDKPAYDPWFSGNDPTNGKGFESAVAYAVATHLGFSRRQVGWVTVPFNSSYAPGPKTFDFDVNQISITAKRKRAVDFSQGYYTVNQAVVTLKGSKYANAKSAAALRGAKLGAQVGTTSLTYVQDVLKPSTSPAVFNDTNDAKSALNAKTVDGIVVDLPTAYYLTAAEIKGSTIVGQFKATGSPEQFGMLFEKGSRLVPCVDRALSEMRSSGELAAIQKRWLSEKTDVPVLT